MVSYPSMFVLPQTYVTLEVDMEDASQKLISSSLSPPSESASDFFSWHSFTSLVCLCLQASISNHISLGNLSVDDVVTLWRTSETRFDHGKGELWLEQFRQNHAFGVDTYLEMAVLSDIFVTDLPTVGRVDEIASSLEIVATISLTLEDFCALILLLSKACEESDMIMKILKGSRAIDLHIAGLFVQNIGAVLVSDAKRLLLFDYSHTFHDVLCVDMDQMVIWFPKFLSLLKDETSFSHAGELKMQDMHHQVRVQDREIFFIRFVDLTPFFHITFGVFFI